MRTVISVVCDSALHGVSTHVDRLGRPIRAEGGDSAGIKSIVDIEYDSCACSPLGNVTTITNPAGKWKKYVTDALGNLIQVIEPNPGNN